MPSSADTSEQNRSNIRDHIEINSGVDSGK